MEIWDGYYENGSLAGVDLIRGEPIPEGLYHLVSQVLIRHSDGDFLLMLRSSDKDIYPGYYEAGAGGSALKGENAIDCARRELKEETGLYKGSLSFLGTYLSKNTIYVNYMFITGCDKSSIVLQEGETQGYKWVSEGEFIAFVNSDRIIPNQRRTFYDFFTYMDYIEE